jgi:hypothetical protein
MCAPRFNVFRAQSGIRLKAQSPSCGFGDYGSRYEMHTLLLPSGPDCDADPASWYFEDCDCQKYVPTPSGVC